MSWLGLFVCFLIFLCMESLPDLCFHTSCFWSHFDWLIKPTMGWKHTHFTSFHSQSFLQMSLFPRKNIFFHVGIVFLNSAQVCLSITDKYKWQHAVKVTHKNNKPRAPLHSNCRRKLLNSETSLMMPEYRGKSASLCRITENWSLLLPSTEGPSQESLFLTD